MLDRLYRLARRLLSLAQDTHENKTNLKKLEERLDKLSDAVRELAFEIRRVREDDEHEREKMALRLENVLLRFEREMRAAPALGPRRSDDPE
jgi:chromosome segregation ATPase